MGDTLATDLTVYRGITKDNQQDGQVAFSNAHTATTETPQDDPSIAVSENDKVSQRLSVCPVL